MNNNNDVFVCTDYRGANVILFCFVYNLISNAIHVSIEKDYFKLHNGDV